MKKYMSKFYIKSLFLFSILFISKSYSLNIIFDLGGVLIENSKAQFIQKIGFWPFFNYCIKCNNPLNLKSLIFDTLNKVPTNIINNFKATDNTDNRLPNILCAWLTGKDGDNQITSEEIIIRAHETILNDSYLSKSEKILMYQIISLMFNPENLVESTYVLKEGLKFVEMCSELSKEEGHNLFIISNWDSQSGELLIKKHPELFELFDKDKILLSGNIGLMKPDPEIFKLFLTKYQLNPDECIFFDDQKVNVDSANEIGINAVLCKNLKCQDMIKKFNKFTKKVGLKSLKQIGQEKLLVIS